MLLYVRFPFALILIVFIKNEKVIIKQLIILLIIKITL